MTVFVALTRLLTLPTGTVPATVALTAERRTLSHDRALQRPIGEAALVCDAQERENEAGKIIAAERLKRVSVRGTHTQAVLTGLLLLYQNGSRTVICQKNVDML